MRENAGGKPHRRHPDAELAMINSILRKLSTVNKPTRTRVLAYVNARVDELPDDAQPEITEDPFREEGDEPPPLIRFAAERAQVGK